MIASILSRLGWGTTDDPNPTTGPEQIAHARAELRDDTEPDAATIGRARLEDYSGEFTNDLKAVIPLHIRKYDDPTPLLFDVDGDRLADFCAAYDVDVTNIGALEGETVPLRWDQGQPTANWHDLTPQKFVEDYDE